jgi:DNA-binding CsgD family transcriptional regulator
MTGAVEAAEMKKKKIAIRNSGRARIQRAEARATQAEARTEQAKTRTEAAETRTEQAETRTDEAKSRTEKAETRTEQAEASLQRATRQGAGLQLPALPLKYISNAGPTDGNNRLQRLTIRQREILQLIAEGQTTKQIGDILKVSPKTVEYHRAKLMAGLNLHDIPGLVRFALRAGLVPSEK